MTAFLINVVNRAEGRGHAAVHGRDPGSVHHLVWPVAGHELDYLARKRNESRIFAALRDGSDN